MCTMRACRPAGSWGCSWKIVVRIVPTTRSKGIDVAVDPRDAGGGVGDAGQPLEADAEGEQFSDDVVVQVEGDAVVIF